MAFKEPVFRLVLWKEAEKGKNRWKMDLLLGFANQKERMMLNSNACFRCGAARVV
jgi:hypothetical protein